MASFAWEKISVDKTPILFHNVASKERSRSATKSNTSGSGHRLRSQSPKLTLPKTPNLTTRGRSRPVHALTTEEKEMLEFEEHQKLAAFYILNRIKIYVICFRFIFKMFNFCLQGRALKIGSRLQNRIF